jgi:integrase
LPRCVIRRVPNKIARRNPKPVIVPIHPVLLEMLSAIPISDRSEYVLPKTAALYNRRTDLVTDMVQRHFIACGLKPHKPGTGKPGKRAIVETGFHSLRHSFVTMCRANNVPLSIVESLVGHSNPQMSRVYTHVSESAACTAISSLPAIIGHVQPKARERDPASILRDVLALAHEISAKNWRDRKATLLELLSNEE